MKTADLKFTELCEEIDRLRDQLVTEKLLYDELEDKYNDLIQSTTRSPESELKRNIDLISYGREQTIEKINNFKLSDDIIKIFRNFINVISPQHRPETNYQQLVDLIDFYKDQLLKELEK